MRKRIGRLAVLVTLGALLGGGCADQPRARPIERSDLVADPAAKLRMPGADELGHVGGERRQTLDGEQFAFDGYVFGTAATSDQVFSYYGAELARLGWIAEGTGGSMSTVELDVGDWCSPKAWFRLGIQDQARAYQPAFYKGKTYTTVFDARLQGGGDGTAPCPPPKPSPSR